MPRYPSRRFIPELYIVLGPFHDCRATTLTNIVKIHLPVLAHSTIVWYLYPGPCWPTVSVDYLVERFEASKCKYDWHYGRIGSTLHPLFHSRYDTKKARRGLDPCKKVVLWKLAVWR